MTENIIILGGAISGAITAVVTSSVIIFVIRRLFAEVKEKCSQTEAAMCRQSIAKDLLANRLHGDTNRQIVIAQMEANRIESDRMDLENKDLLIEVKVIAEEHYIENKERSYKFADDANKDHEENKTAFRKKAGISHPALERAESGMPISMKTATSIVKASDGKIILDDLIPDQYK